MKSYIKAIIVFSKTGEKRFVKLTEGLNIISGESMSGKSALLEIIDYCLGNSVSTIPKGKIEDFANIYSIIFVINNETIVLGRHKYNNGGRYRMYFKHEKRAIDVEDISMDYFNTSNLFNIKEALRKIEYILGLKITDMTEEYDSDKEGKPSIRNMVSYLFQHQNLIASKFALFYRFDNPYKKESVIKEFPVFAGWVDQEYYSNIYRLDKLNKELKRKQKEIDQYKKIEDDLRQRLYNSFLSYYALIGEKLSPNLSLQELLNLRNNLPSYTNDSYLSNDIEERYQNLRDELEKRKEEKHRLLLSINNLRSSQSYGDIYSDKLRSLEEKLKYSHPKKHNYECPLCGNECKEINEQVVKLNQAKNWLASEVPNIHGQKRSFGEEIVTLENKKDILDSQIRDLLKQIKNIENLFKEIDSKARHERRVIYEKARIDMEAEIVTRNYFRDDEEEVDRLKEEIEDIKRKISFYDLEKYFGAAETFLSKNMSKIVGLLDFEKEFKPVNLRFDLKTFDLYLHVNTKEKRDKIYLSEMGSGANWLSCHLALFLSLLHFFCSMRQSVIPTILLLDQPSQVYFPEKVGIFNEQNQYSEIIDQEDVQAVKKIYNVILDEVEQIERDYNFKPQIIVTDHVGSLKLENYDFDSYIRKRWRDGKKFI